MTILKPKMLKGELKNLGNNKTLFAAGLIFGALGSDITIKVSSDYIFDESDQYLIKVLKSSGCLFRKTNDNINFSHSALTKGVLVDANRCADKIYYMIVYLCFLRGESKIYGIEKLSDDIKTKIYSLIGNLKMIGADILVRRNEVVFYGRQVLSGAELTCYGDFDIFSALCIAAHRCEGNLALKGYSCDKDYMDFIKMLTSLDADLTKKDFDLNMKKNIVLTGMSGAGKSYVGKAVAEKLDFSFYDSDAEFVKEEKSEISEVFKAKGEEYFRKRESEVIKKLSQKGGCVISTGGGSILKEENIINLKENGVIIYLERDIETIINTVDASGRPLFKGGKDSIKKLYNDRKELYKTTADYKVSNNGALEKTVNKIIEIYEDVIK